MDLHHDLSLELGPLEPPLNADSFANENTNDSQHVPEAAAVNLQNPTQTVKKVDSFATPSNLASAANYVNLLLTAEGYPVPLIFDSKNEEDICKIVNCLKQVLEDKKNDAEERALLAERLNELRQERQRLQTALDSCRKELNESKNENVRLSSRLESANKSLKEESNKLRTAKDELSKAKNNMQYMKSQYAHEVRRHEQDHAKTKERLYKLMDERTRTNVASYTVNEPIPVDALENGNEGTGENNIMYTDLLAKSSDREKEARIENDSLRRLFADIYAAVTDLLQRQYKKYANTFPKTPPSANQEIVDWFRLPIDVGCTKAIEETHKLLARLQEEWDRQIAKRKVYSEEDMKEKEDAIHRLEQSNDELIETLRICRTEFEEKAKIYMRYADGGFFDYTDPNANASLSDSESSVVFDDQESETSNKKLRQTAIAERRKATEAAIKLGDERSKLQAERWAFEEMKLQLQMQNLFSDTTISSTSRKRAREED